MYLYIFKLTGHGETFVKVGLTSFIDLERRLFKSHGFEIKDIWLGGFQNAEEAEKTMDYFITEYATFKTDSPENIDFEHNKFWYKMEVDSALNTPDEISEISDEIFDEQKICELLDKGMKGKEIALKFHISASTVTRIKQKNQKKVIKLKTGTK